MIAGDIVLIQFPFTDLTSTKVRPALVISSDAQQQSSADAIFMMLSSNTTNLRSTDFLLESRHPEFPATGLKQTAVFRTDKIHSLQRTLAKRHLGVIGPRIRREIVTRFNAVIGL